MNVAYTTEDRQKVRSAYVFECLSFEQVAQFTDIPVQTVRRWAKQARDKGDDWDRLRDAHLISGGGANNAARAGITGLMVLIRSTIDRLNNDKELSPIDAAKAIASVTDSLHKVTSASKKLLPEVSELVTAMEVIQELSEYIQTKHKSALPLFVEILPEFGAHIEKKYGDQS